MRKLTFLTVLLTLIGLTTAAPADFGQCNFTFVSGDLMITEVTEDTVTGEFTGDIVGTLVSTIVGVETFELPFGTVTVLSTESVITTDDGTITMDDTVYNFPIGGSGINYWVGRHNINGGTGGFEGASGKVLTRGLLPEEGLPMLTYIGLVSVPE
jgi:hypothetical protein